MTCQTETPCSATLTSSSSPDKRVRYGLGMLLGVADFEQEQAWFLEQDRGHARTLHGCGVVGGLHTQTDNELPVCFKYGKGPSAQGKPFAGAGDMATAGRPVAFSR